MPKKACCCAVPGGNYLAIPCRFSLTTSFSNGLPNWAHWRGGSPTPIGGFGGGQFELNGPFRYIDGQLVFDTTRDILYMMRGAGGGASGVTFNYSYGFGAGGNGSYIEYKKNANINDVVKSGAGGCGASENVQWNIIPENYQNGGEAYAINGDGGGASVIGTNTNWYEQPAAVVGGGGGAGFVLSNLEPLLPFIGGKQGGDAGIVAGDAGEPGVYYEAFNSSPPPPGLCGSGGGGTQTSGGTGGGGGINNRAKNGTRFSGGQGSIRVGAGGIVGSGGGGGGGLYGGGGGAYSGAGGGGSSTIVSGREEYEFKSKNNLSANYCNPYMNPVSGVGGRRLPLVSSFFGENGEVVQYYIYGECECDPKKNTVPEQMFVCLNSVQYASIIEALGPAPDNCGGFDPGCTPLFTIDDEDYQLLGLCNENCEDVYKVPPGTGLTQNARWVVNSGNNGAGGFDPDGPNGPPCCSQIVCVPVCPIEGVNCANCGCDTYSEVFTCCDTKGKPDTYTSVYNGWIYACTKSNNNWIVPGTITETVTQLCMDPFDGPAPNCTPTDIQDCIKNVNEPAPCTPRNAQNCTDLAISVLGPQVYFLASDVGCPGIYSYKIQGSIPIDPGTFSGRAIITPNIVGYCRNPQYALDTIFDFVTTSIIENVPILRIEFDCVPEFLGSSIPFDIFTSVWKICDATVNVTEGYLSTIATTFNSLLAGRVILTDLTSGKYHTSFNNNGNIVRTINNGKATYTVYATHEYVKACGNVTYYIWAADGAISDPGPGLPSATEGRRSYFVGGEVDTWEPLTNLGVSNCNCSISPINECPEYTGCAPCFDDVYYDCAYKIYNGGVPACSNLIVS